jgi:signal transduction histidine kinase
VSIRLRLALQFGIILAITLLLFSLAIYFSRAQSRRNSFTQSLFSRAMVVAHVYAEGKSLAGDGNQTSYRRYLRKLYQTLPAEEGRVYDAADRLVFREGQPPAHAAVPKEWLAEVRQQGRAVLEPEKNYHETVGLLYLDPHLGPLVVVASSVDEASQLQMRELRQVLALGFLGSLLVMGVGSWLIAGRALRPLRRMVREVDGITATAMSKRLTQAEGTADEIGHLAQRFNRLLDRLEAAFAGQRTFVRDASHELRTPLTALIGELEVALLQQERPVNEYRRVLQSTLDAARQLTSLTNGLLEIARASGDPSQVPMSVVRLDELLLMAHEQILRRYPTSRVDLDFGDPAEEAGTFIVRGNEALLLAAMLNVLDNACKFSASTGQPITAALAATGPRIVLTVTDQGPGLDAADLQQVFVPFFRSEAMRGVPGHGIGLPLTAQIMALHGGAVKVESQLEKGTSVKLEYCR